MREAYQDQRLATEAAQMRAQVEEDIAHAQAIPMHEAYEARATHDKEVTEKWIDNDAANDLAEMRMFGSQGREYVDPQTGEQLAGQIVQEGPNKGQRVELPSMREQILSSPRYATAKDERKRIANQYEDAAKDLLGQGLSFSQTEAVLNHMGFGSDQAGPADRVRRLTGKFITGGNSIEDAQARARQTVDKENDRFLKETLTTEQYDKWQKRIEDMNKARREAAERAEAARKKAEADERERRAAEKAAEEARKAAEAARKAAEEEDKPEEPPKPDGDDDGGNGGGNTGPRMPQELPGPGKPGETAPPLLEKGPNIPLEDPYRNSNGVVRWLRGHPSGKITNAMKYAFGGLKRGNREDRQKVEVILADDKSTLNQKLQALDEAGAYKTKLLLERAAMAGRDLTADLENAGSLREVKKIIKDAQPTGNDAIKARMARADVLGTGEGDARQNRYDVGGNPKVSEAEARYNEALIRSATPDQLESSDWWEANNLTEDTMSPANMALAALRTREAPKVRAAQEAAAAANTPVSPTQRRPSRREQRRARREAEENDEGSRSLRERIFGPTDPDTAEQINEIRGMTNEEIIALQPDEARRRFTKKAFQRYERERRQIIV